MWPHFGTWGVQGTIGNWTKCVSVFLSILLMCCSGLPISLRNYEGNVSVSAVSQAVEFLTRFGYLPASDPKSSNLRSESEFRQAVAAMQYFGGLEPTGLIDRDTIRLMEARRCGVPDYLSARDRHRIKRYAIQGQKWPHTNLTWSVRSDVDASEMVRSQLRRAFGVWSEASVLEFMEIVTGSADIVVQFLRGPHGDGYPFDGEGSVLAHAFFPGDGIGGDAHFDAEERWLSTEPQDDDGVNLFAVAAHEIGHSLGLSHSSTPGSLMFPYYQIIGDHFKLPKDDADGIKHLYGTKDTNPFPMMPTLAPTTYIETTTSTKKAKIKTKKPFHKPKKSTTKPTVTTTELPSQMPDICNSSIDAISVIRRELFVFKGKYFWRLDMNRTLRTGYPVSIDRFWYDLPTNITKIDALYERPTDTKILFFSGKYYWLFSANQLEPGFPQPLTNLGLPDDLERIDAAMVWGHNGKTYLFSGKQYWKFDEEMEHVELDYPRSITAWRGVPQNLDAAFQWTDGNTYFFKSDKYWKFVDAKMKIDKKAPSEIGGFWFNCLSETKDNNIPVLHTEVTTEQQTNIENSSSALCAILSLYVLFFNFFLVYCGIKIEKLNNR